MDSRISEINDGSSPKSWQRIRNSWKSQNPFFFTFLYISEDSIITYQNKIQKIIEHKIIELQLIIEKENQKDTGIKMNNYWEDKIGGGEETTG